MVLPTEKVMYQAQEVAAVIATDRYAAADGVDAVEVEYEPLPVVVDPFKALEPGAPVLRTDKKDKKDNHIFHWEAGDRAGHRAALRRGRRRGQAGHLHPAHPRRLDRDLRLRRRLRPAHGQAHRLHDDAGAARDPHRLRARGRPRRPVGGEDPDHLARHRRRLRRQGAGLSRATSSRSPPRSSSASRSSGSRTGWRTCRPTPSRATTTCTAELAAKKDGTMTALRIKTVADHGYTDAAANPSKFPAGLFSICTGSYDIKHAFAEVDGVYTNKPPGGVAYRCSFRVTEAVHAIERMVDVLAQRAEDGSGRAADEELHPAGASSPTSRRSAGSTTAATTRRRCSKAMDMIGYAELRKEQAEKRAARRADGHRHLELHRDRRRRAVEALRHPRHQDVRLVRDPRPPDRQGDRPLRHEVAGPGARDDLRADRRRGAGHPGGARRRSRKATPTPRRTASGTYASRSTPTAGAAGAMAARKIRDKARKIAAHLLEVRGGGPGLGAGQVLGQGRAAEVEDDPGDRVRRLHQPSAGHGGGARGASTTTTRRTSPSRSAATSAWWTSTAARAR